MIVCFSFFVLFVFTQHQLVRVSYNTIQYCAKDFPKLARQIIADRLGNLSTNPAVRHGTFNEEICRRLYVCEKANSKLSDFSLNDVEVIIQMESTRQLILVVWWLMRHRLIFVVALMR